MGNTLNNCCCASVREEDPQKEVLKIELKRVSQREIAVQTCESSKNQSEEDQEDDEQSSDLLSINLSDEEDQEESSDDQESEDEDVFELA